MATAPRGVDIGQTLDAGAWTAFQKLVLALASLAFLVDGIANQVLGLAVPALMRDWGLPREAFATVTAIGLVGLTIGAAAGGMLGDRLGRRTVLIASVFVFGAMTVAVAFTHQVSDLFWIRFFDGIGIGAAIPNGAALISEFTPKRRRPLAIAIGMAFIAIGSVLAGLAATPLLPTVGWRGLFITLGAIPLALSLIFFLLLPESPLYLARHPKRKADLLRVMRRCGLPLAPDSTIIGDDPNAKKAAPLRAILEREVRSSTIAVWVAFFFCLLASYTMFSWVPAMLASLGFPLSMTSLGMTAFSTGGVIGGIVGGWLIERLGSRTAVLGQTAGAIVGALMLAGLVGMGASDIAILFWALAFMGFFLSGLINGLYTLSTLIYPPQVRATGVGSAAAVGRLGAIVSSYTGPIALQVGGASGYFFVIAAALAVSFIGVALVNRHIAANQSSPAEQKAAAST
ncbi:MAG: MFS transporter [Hyphomonadaceae bacterium]|nr:MFS transporter [Hyphomonadaceae bacterium]